ncbi:putative peptidyl-tRNA hydrolase [Exaiptasia diaphana]|nr:putative peptidyl-tRNA hydrolase [Exaiptasia diaphana]
MPETRHSIGMTVINDLANKLEVKWQQNKRFSGFYGITQVNQLEVILFKSKLLMNINGRSVFKIACAYNIQPSHILLIHDDLDKVLGKYSFKNGGSARGHNGVKSVLTSFKSCDFKRLLVGIGRPANRSQVVEYVLQKFTDQENDVVTNIVDECSELVLNHLKVFALDQNARTLKK